MEELTPIEALMSKKLREDYDAYLSLRNRNQVLMKKLKRCLASEVAKMIRGTGVCSPPYDPFSITQVGKATIRVIYDTRSEIGADGSIDASDEGFIIRIDRRLLKSKFRLRSTMAHELMHTVFYDAQQLPPMKVGVREPSRKDFFMEEELCYYLARQFLMPDFSLLDLMQKEDGLRTPSLTNLQALKDKYVVSSDLVAFRLIKDLAVWDVLFIKSIKTDSLFRTAVMKSKGNKFYKKIQTPKLIPSSRTVWADSFSKHINEVTRTGPLKEIVNLSSKEVALESRIEARTPLSIVTLVCELSNSARASPVWSFADESGSNRDRNIGISGAKSVKQALGM
jgi:Zn-dependent peptidase ImmA (M78 family)